MNKLVKRVFALSLVGVMTFGMAGSVYAMNTAKDSNSQYTNSGDTVASDTDKINLIKDYQIGENVGDDVEAANTSTFNFKITRYGVWNAGSSTGSADGDAYSLSNMPTFSTNIFNIPATTGSTDIEKAQVTLPGTFDDTASTHTNTYNSVGDFWYLVQETATNVTANDDAANAPGLKSTGVVYGTNDAQTPNPETANDNHNGKYYMHVQVVNNDAYVPKPDGTDNRTAIQKLRYLRSVTLHKTPPVKGSTTNLPSNNKEYDEWATSNYPATATNTVKVNEIQNEYYAGSLSVKKEVEGNAADKDKRFEVTVVFTKPANTIINSDITYSAVTSETGTNTDDITIKGQTETDNSKHNWMNGTTKATPTDTAVLTNTVTFWIKAGDTVTFNNIPYGVTYTVTESDPNGTNGANNSYENKIETTDDETAVINWAGISCAADTDSPTYSNVFTKQAKGSIANDLDTVTITNKKNVSIDIGVIVDNAPYIAMLAIAAGALVLFLIRRKRTTEV